MNMGIAIGAIAALLAGETTVPDMIDALLSRPLKAERH